MESGKSKKNLNSGTKTTENFLSGKEICTIIEICAKKGVGEFTYGPLSFNFGNTKAPQPARNGNPSSENVILEQKIIEKDALLSEELQTKEEKIAELTISDPLLAEELMAEGELEEASEEDLEDDA